MLTISKYSGGNCNFCTHVYPQYEPRDRRFVWCTEERYGYPRGIVACSGTHVQSKLHTSRTDTLCFAHKAFICIPLCSDKHFVSLAQQDETTHLHGSGIVVNAQNRFRRFRHLGQPYAVREGSVCRPLVRHVLRPY